MRSSATSRCGLLYDTGSDAPTAEATAADDLHANGFVDHMEGRGDVLVSSWITNADQKPVPTPELDRRWRYGAEIST